MGKSKAAPERLTAAERKQRAVELRKLGFSYQKIADQMGISQSGAHKMVTSALNELNEETAESAAELRRLELERLDEWLLRVAQEIKAGRILGAIDRGIRIMNRRARLLGLDAPSKMEVIDRATFTELEAAARAGESWAIEELQRIAAGEPPLLRSWMRHRFPECTADDTDRMTPEELAMAAQGKLTRTELERIRERPVADEAESEG